MARKPRIQYEGAIYHVMSRGDRKEPIFLTETDYTVFLQTLGETCLQTGWVIHAWVLMKNHYHILLETPQANLVDGMKWLQGTYTQRFNSTHQLSGHLFQGRYKALLVDQGDPHYFRCVASYIHLNPARAGLIDLDSGNLADFVWSSYPGYLEPNKRTKWLEVNRLLSSYQANDTIMGRRHFQLQLEKRCLEIKNADEPWRIEKDWDSIRRGWYFGEDSFKEEMLEKMEPVVKGNKEGSFSGQGLLDHSIKHAEKIITLGVESLGLSEGNLTTLQKSDLKKKVLAWCIKKHTRVPNEWVAQRLTMGHPANLAKFCREVEGGDSDIMSEYKLRLEKHLNTRTDPL